VPARVLYTGVRTQLMAEERPTVRKPITALLAPSACSCSGTSRRITDSVTFKHRSPPRSPRNTVDDARRS
jgi:hypothetical protein